MTRRLLFQLTVTVPHTLLERAELKAKLVNDLIHSIKNDRDGVIDSKLELEILTLAKKLIRAFRN